MKRRKFIRNSGYLAGGAFLLGNMRIGMGSPITQKIAKVAAANDKVLVLIQLNGGNDGLNTLVPLDQYSNLFKARANLIVPENEILKISDNNGFHPAMTGIKDLFEDGKVGVVQNVGYPQQNQSHFRSTDIWTSASDSNEVITSGWLGRYLAEDHPLFPEGYPSSENPDPLSITLGSVISTTCQGPIYNMGMAINSVDEFIGLNEEGTDAVPDTYAGEQIEFLRTLAVQSNKYFDSVSNAASSGTDGSNYPNTEENNLAAQLQTVARLISGGLQTKIYVCSIGGFDTHANQVQDENGTIGQHYDLLNQVSSAVKAFQDDLKNKGLEDKVLTMTFSEFGRRIKSNGSNGTDHGAAAPLFVFGSKVNPIIHGNNPIIEDEISVQDNLPMEFDFRSVYYSILLDWFEVEKTDLDEGIMLNEYPHIELIKKGPNSINNFIIKQSEVNVFPNPISNIANLEYFAHNNDVSIWLFDNRGNKIEEIYRGRGGNLNLTILKGRKPIGSYFLRINDGGKTGIKKLQFI